jgi:hypothetical protein
MAINLKDIFGNEINVSFQLREPNNQYTDLPEPTVLPA